MAEARGRSANGRYQVAWGGTLRNARSLTDELRGRQIPLRTADDDGTASAAELAANVLGDMGVPGGLDRLEGDFAFVALDIEQNRAFLVRDRAGALPLYLSLTAGQAHFDTDARSLACTVGAARDPSFIPRYLALGYLPAPLSPYVGIQKLEAGSWLGLAPAAEGVNRDASGRWWPLLASPQGFEGSRIRWEKTVEYAIELAVQQRIGIPGPVAVLHGGGVFSEALFGSVAERRRDGVMVLAGVLPDGGLLPGQSLARLQVSTQRLGRDAIEIELPSDPLSMPDRLIEPMDRPERVLWETLADVARREDVGAVLTGAGGAELFGVGLRRSDRWRPARWRGAEAAPGADDQDLRRFEAEAPTEQSSWVPWARRDPIATALWVARRSVLPDGLLPALGELGIEAPLCDPHVGAVVAQVPLGVLLGGGAHGLFARALRARISADASPLSPELPLDCWLAPHLLALSERLAGLVAPEAVAHALAAQTAGDSRIAWRLAVLARWWHGA